MSHLITNAQLSLLSDAGRLPALANVAVAFAVVVTKWDTRRRTRAQLKNLTPHLLKDIGVDPITAAREAAKPFWTD